MGEAYEPASESKMSEQGPDAPYEPRPITAEELPDVPEPPSGPETYVQDEKKAEVMAYAEKPNREEAIASVERAQIAVDVPITGSTSTLNGQPSTYADVEVKDEDVSSHLNAAEIKIEQARDAGEEAGLAYDREQQMKAAIEAAKKEVTS